MKAMRLWSVMLVAVLAACGSDPEQPPENNAMTSENNATTPENNATTPMCSASESLCGMVCVDTATSSEHCGMCDSACQSGEACVSGACELQCEGGQVACDGGCIDPMTDADFCGASATCTGDDAGEACGDGGRCDAGACVQDCDAQGLTECAVNMCVDTTMDVMNCGGCDSPCEDRANAAASCDASTCDYACDEGFGDCNLDIEADGCEQPLDAVEHCGECGNVCPTEDNASSACDGTECGELTCEQGFLDCNGDLGQGGDGCETNAPFCPSVDWLFTLGRTGDDTPISNGQDVEVAVDSAGNTIAAMSNGGGHAIGMTEYTFDRFGTLVISLDNNSQQRWVRSFRDTIADNPFLVGDAIFHKVLVDPMTDDVYLIGSGWGEGMEMDGVSIAAVNSQCAGVAVKLDGVTGTLEWAQSFPDSTCSSLRDATVTSNGLLVGGGFQGTMMLGMDSVTATATDMFFAYLDPATGAVTDGATISSPGDQLLYDIEQLAGGDIALVGTYGGADAVYGGTTLTNSGGNDILLMRADAMGAVQWVRGWGGTESEHIQELDVGANGALYASGTYNVSLTIGNTTLSGGGFGLWLGRFDPMDGSPDWVIGTESGNTLFPLRSDFFLGANDEITLGFHLATGMSSGFGGQQLADVNAGRIVTVDGVTGNATHVTELVADSSILYVGGIAGAPDGKIVVVGYFSPNASLYGEPFMTAGDIDQFILRLGQ